VLLASVVVVLALAAANVANLSLVRMIVRGREVAVRAALGAGSARLLRQFLTESLLLSSIGGLVGLIVAWWGTKWLAAFAAAQIPRIREVGIDLGVFSFLFVVCAAGVGRNPPRRASNQYSTYPAVVRRARNTHGRFRRFRACSSSPDRLCARLHGRSGALLVRG
jgi:predicted lysophospholipase L1 biosynthesis ABC-type transport system permease subunit